MVRTSEIFIKQPAPPGSTPGGLFIYKKIFKKIFICHIKYEPERVLLQDSYQAPGVTARDNRRKKTGGRKKMKIVYCESTDMFFSGEDKESSDLNRAMEGIGTDATIILTDPEHSRCEAVIHMREFCCSAINLEGLEIVDNGDAGNMLYKPIHKDDTYLTFYAYDTKEKAEAAKERIREAIKFFNGGKGK